MNQMSFRQVAKVDLASLLYPYQKIGANYLHDRKAALLADQMGLGKTVQALAAIRDDEGAAIVCPASLIANWKRELRRFRPELNLTDSPTPHPWEVSITSYASMPTCLVSEDRPPQWKGDRPKHPFTLILDEAHYVKNAKSIRGQRVRAYADVATRVWALTGTPLMNRPSELWSLLQACKWSGKKVFGSWDNFVDMFNGKKKYFGGYEWGDPKPEVKTHLDRFMLRRMRDEVLPELPTKTYRDIEVHIAKKGILKQDFRYIDDWSDAEFEEECEETGSLAAVRAELAEAKHEALESIVEQFAEEEEPLIVFSMHRAIPEHLGQHWPGWARIMGGISQKERDRVVQAFQDGKLSGIAGTIGAMGVGLTLTRAAHVLFVDRSFVPSENLQAEDRLCRIGQTRGVVVHRLIANHPVDRRVAEILEKKTRLLEGAGLT